MAGNPRLGEADDWVIGIPQVELRRDPESGDEYGLTHLPTTISAQVFDPDSPTGSRPYRKAMRSFAIVPPEESEKRRFHTERTCLACRHFQYTAGQAFLKTREGARFVKVIQAAQWARYAGIGPKDYGICADRESMTSVANTCANWRPGRGGYQHAVSSGKRALAAVGKTLFGPQGKGT